ncbi:MAG: 30S ribosomal protein S2 [Actinomycetota bacterium]|nr:30S ribosomal protein S2 [Actinomycetota bacterium]
MSVVSMRQLLEAGMHFGHQTRRWNPKMRPYIFTERNGIHIIDLRQTLEQVERSYALVRDAVADGGTVLFVGTKKQAQGAIQEAADKAGMPYVNHRWLGGMLTNFQTIHKRILYMLELEQMESSGEMESLPKKERLRLRRELEKLHTVLGGVRDMKRPPDAVFVIDVITEHIAVAEAKRLAIPLIAIVDTNCDPDPVDIVIPGNDDAIRTILLISDVIAEAAKEGREIREATRKDATVKDAPAKSAPIKKEKEAAPAPTEVVILEEIQADVVVVDEVQAEVAPVEDSSTEDTETPGVTA